MKMRLNLLAGALALVASGALAADNYGYVPAPNPSNYLKSKEVAPGVQSPQVIPSDESGNAILKQGNPGVVDTVVRSPTTDVGGTITAGGTAQTFAPANANRRGFVFQNQSTGELRINCSGVSATLDFHSLLVPAGQLYSTDPHHIGSLACSVIGATTGQAFYARVF